MTVAGCAYFIEDYVKRADIGCRYAEVRAEGRTATSPVGMALEFGPRDREAGTGHGEWLLRDTIGPIRESEHGRACFALRFSLVADRRRNDLLFGMEAGFSVVTVYAWENKGPLLGGHVGLGVEYRPLFARSGVRATVRHAWLERSGRELSAVAAWGFMW